MKKITLTHLVFILIFISSLLWLSKSLFLGYYPDFAGYYYGPNLMLDGINPYRGGEGLHTTYVYPPIVLLIFIPILLFNFQVAGVLWMVLNLFFLSLSFYILSKTFDMAFFSKMNLLFMSLALASFPVKFSFGMGQINILILLLLVICLWFVKKKQEFRAGLFLGASLVIKLFPIFIPLYFFIKIKKLQVKFKDRFHWSGFLRVRIFNNKIWIWPSQINENGRFILGITTAVAISVLLILVFVPLELSTHFALKILPDMSNSWKLDYYNQSLSGFVGRFFGVDFEGTAIRFASSAIISLFTLYCVTKNARNDYLTNTLKFGTLITASLIINTFSWQHHFVWLIIPFYATYYFIEKNKLEKKYFIILSLSYLLIAINFKDPQLLPAIFQSHGFFGAAVLLGLSIRLLFLKQQK